MFAWECYTPEERTEVLIELGYLPAIAAEYSLRFYADLPLEVRVKFTKYT